MIIDTDPTTQDAMSILIVNYNEGKPPEAHLDADRWLYDEPARQMQDEVNPKTATLMRARPTAESGMRGRVSVYYHRIDLDNIADFSLRSAPTTVHALLNAINERLGIKLVAADVVDAPVVVGEILTIPVKATSILFVGQLNIQILAV